MSRIALMMPKLFLFSTEVPVMITDINYGNHLGNDKVLAIVHEARVRLLSHWGGSELDIMGTGLIMADAAVQYRAECFYGTVLEIFVAADDLSASSFDLLFLLRDRDTKKEIARVKTGMVCFDYANKRIVRVPDALKNALSPSSHTRALN